MAFDRRPESGCLLKRIFYHILMTLLGLWRRMHNILLCPACSHHSHPPHFPPPTPLPDFPPEPLRVIPAPGPCCPALLVPHISHWALGWPAHQACFWLPSSCSLSLRDLLSSQSSAGCPLHTPAGLPCSVAPLPRLFTCTSFLPPPWASVHNANCRCITNTKFSDCDLAFPPSLCYLLLDSC